MWRPLPFQGSPSPGDTEHDREQQGVDRTEADVITEAPEETIPRGFSRIRV